MRTRLVGGGLAVALAAVLAAGCSNATNPPTPGAPPPGSPTAAAVPADHNAADVAFLQGMIPHHRQAVDMTGLAAARAASPAVKDLADRIAGAQGPEIEQMDRMLAAWGAPAAGGIGDMGGMVGMMSGDQMSQLGAATGPVFDRMFLQMMTEHHRGAISQAQTELAEGRNPEAEQLAEAIISAQQAEITEMQTLLTRV